MESAAAARLHEVLVARGQLPRKGESLALQLFRSFSEGGKDSEWPRPLSGHGPRLLVIAIALESALLTTRRWSECGCAYIVALRGDRR